MQQLRVTEAIWVYQDGQVDIWKGSEQAHFPVAVFLEELAACKVAVSGITRRRYKVSAMRRGLSGLATWGWTIRDGWRGSGRRSGRLPQQEI